MKAKKVLMILFGAALAMFFGGVVASVTSNAIGIAAAVASFSAIFLPLTPVGSLAAIINFAGTQFNGKEVMSMTEAVFDDAYENPELTTFHVIAQGIVASQQILFLGTLSKITKADAGCDDSPGSPQVDVGEKFWQPVRAKFWLAECADNLEETFFVWGLDNGIKRKDLTRGDFAKFMMQRIQEALIEDIQRIVWFNDADHNTVDNSPGLLTLGTDITDYNILAAGLWSQIYADVASNPTRRYTISENNAGSKTAQDALSTTAAIDMLRSMYHNADKRLKHNKNKFFILTDSLVDNYQTWLESQAVDSSFTRVQAGERGQFDTGLRFRGIPIFCFDFWDRTIRADFDNGTTYYQPHRALLTVRENIPVGVDGTEAMKSMIQHWDVLAEKTHWKGAFKIDAKLMKSYMYMAAY